ncbi:MAG: hypothetical protein AAF591_02875 [Verrucomicrobiota bacterium]
MIALPAQMPLLQVGSLEVAEYEKEWLQETIVRAAEQAGHEKWWFAEDVAKSVIIYLQKRFNHNTITLNELFDKVSRTLSKFGFADVANALTPTPPLLRISLAEIARESGPGFELFFFQSLGSKLDELFALDADRIHCADLKRAVKLLAGSPKKWTPACSELKEEIIDFIVQSVEKKSTPPDLSLMIR